MLRFNSIGSSNLTTAEEALSKFAADIHSTSIVVSVQLDITVLASKIPLRQASAPVEFLRQRKVDKIARQLFRTAEERQRYFLEWSALGAVASHTGVIKGFYPFLANLIPALGERQAGRRNTWFLVCAITSLHFILFIRLQALTGALRRLPFYK
jgi:hypothetical protein